jgi:hypothetical protein
MTTALLTRSPDCAKNGPNYSHYEKMDNFLRNFINVGQGFKKKGYPTIVVVYSTCGGKEKPYVKERQGEFVYGYQIHVDRLFHEYDPVDPPEGKWDECYFTTPF